MNKNRLKELAKNPEFISGIYNYCDRWCERCPFTAKCLNYAIGEEQFSDPESRDFNNEKFWNQISEMLKMSLEMVKEMAEERGINLDEIDRIEAQEREKRLDKEGEKNPNCISAKIYISKVDSWFESSKDIFDDKEEEIILKAELGLPEETTEAEVLLLNDAIEVIRWYQHQIYVKIKRAVQGKIMELSEEEDDYPKDTDGSAKVALIGIDRSITMWSKLLEFFPVKEDSLLDILVQLERLRRNVEKEFPDARNFKRPGFDYIPEELQKKNINILN